MNTKTYRPIGPEGIRVGGTYLSRSGEQVKIVNDSGSRTYPFRDYAGFSYMESGRYCNNEGQSNHDLILEIIQEDAQPVEAPTKDSPLKLPCLEAMIFLRDNKHGRIDRGHGVVEWNGRSEITLTREFLTSTFSCWIEPPEKYRVIYGEICDPDGVAYDADELAAKLNEMEGGS